MVSIRIVNVDYYMCHPQCDLDIVYSEFRGTEVRQVPVIQIFGASDKGEKTCLNIHGVFPYIYIPYDGIEPPGSLSYKIAAELDKSINISLGQASSNAIHIHNIVLVSGTPLYGYHEKFHQFFKIYFYNPAIVKKACTLLENGAILGKSYQPHESHINFTLQFMMDYNLHGMSFINLASVKYRSNPEDFDKLLDIPSDLILPKSIGRRSVCAFELDCYASDILNIEEIKSGNLGVNPGIAALWEDEKQRRRNKQEDSQISFCLTQERKTIAKPTATHELFAKKLDEKLSQTESLSQDQDSSSLDLDKSVYPAETPDDDDTVIITASDSTVLDTTLLDETLIPDSQPNQMNQMDSNLLEILKELKENAHIEDDSALSQQLPEPVVEYSSEDEDENVLSLPLNKTVQLTQDDNQIWEDSFWDENCRLPQLDGIYDTDTEDGRVRYLSTDLNSEITESSSVISTGKLSSSSFESGSEVFFVLNNGISDLKQRRNAAEVYIDTKTNEIPIGKRLNPGLNKLITSEPRVNDVSFEPKVKIISDFCIKTEKNTKVTWELNKRKVKVNIEKVNEDDQLEYDPLCIKDNDMLNYNIESEFESLDINEVLFNDVNMGNITPISMESIADELSPKTPHGHANQCSCRQSPNISSNRLLTEENMILFSNELYENNLQSSGDKEKTNPQQDTHNFNRVKRNLKFSLSGKRVKGNRSKTKNDNNADKSIKYNLRRSETDKKCTFCTNCSENKIDNCSSNHEIVNNKNTQTLSNNKKINLTYRYFQNILSRLKNKPKPIENNNREKIIVKIPLSAIIRKSGRRKKNNSISTTSSEISLKENVIRQKSTEQLPNRVSNKLNGILKENPLVNNKIRDKKINGAFSSSSSKSSNSDSEKESIFSLVTSSSNDSIIDRNLNNLKLLNLDGQNDTPSSDSEKNSIKSNGKVTLNISKSNRKFRKTRVSGLSKKVAQKESSAENNAPLNLRKRNLKTKKIEPIVNLQEEIIIPPKDDLNTSKNLNIKPEIERNIRRSPINLRKRNVKTKHIEINNLEQEFVTKPKNEQIAEFSETVNCSHSDTTLLIIEKELENKRTDQNSVKSQSDVNLEQIIIDTEQDTAVEDEKILVDIDKLIENLDIHIKSEESQIIQRRTSPRKNKELAQSSTKLSETSKNEDILKNIHNVSVKIVKLDLDNIKSAITLNNIKTEHETLDTSNQTTFDTKITIKSEKIESPTCEQNKTNLVTSTTESRRAKRKYLRRNRISLRLKRPSTDNDEIKVEPPETVVIKKDNEHSEEQIGVKEKLPSKELKISLERIDIEKYLSSNTTAKPTTPELKIVVEPLNEELIQQKTIPVIPEIARRETRNSIKKNNCTIKSDNKETETVIIEQPKDLHETEVKTYNTRRTSLICSDKTNKSCNQSLSISSDSLDDIPEPVNKLKVQKLTPQKSNKKTEIISPKYSPLNVTKSPRKNQIKLNEFEPIRKRRKYLDANENLFTKPENSAKKLKDILNDGGILRGIGELPDIHILQEEKKSEKNTINLKDCDNNSQINSLSASINHSINTLPKKTADSVKINLFSAPRNNTIVEDFQVFSNQKQNSRTDQQQQNVDTPKIETEKKWKQDEEDFLNEIESICKNKTENKLFFETSNIKKPERNIFYENAEAYSKSPVDYIISESLLADKINCIKPKSIDNNFSDVFTTPKRITEKIRKIPEKLNISTMDKSLMKTPEKIPPTSSEKIYFASPEKTFVTPEKVSIITSADYLDYSPFASPEKSAQCSAFVYTPRETLSQQYEKEMSDDLEDHFTKTKNLTVAEKYDLERNFAPQPGTSKESDNYNYDGDDIIENSPMASFSNYFQPSQYRSNYVISSSDESTSPDFLNCSQISALNSKSNEEVIRSIVWTPKYSPPSAEDIRRSLACFNIPENKYPEPFYSNYSDVTRKVDVGHNVLKIPSKTTADLDEFQSSFGFKGIDNWRKEQFNKLYPDSELPKSFKESFSRHSEVILQPALSPPSQKEVMHWVKTKMDKQQTEENNETVKKPEKIRVRIPCSPGNDGESDESFTLSPDVLSPTPDKTLVLRSSQRTPSSTPSSSQESPCLRRKGKYVRKGILKRKALFEQRKEKLKLNESPQSINDSCQITGVTLDNTHGFKMSYENLQNAKAVSEHQYLTILVVELHIRTRGDLNPDPQYDSIRALFYSIYNDVPDDFKLPKEETGVIAINSIAVSPSKETPSPILNGTGLNCKITYVDSETDLINEFIKLIRKWDPDIFSGFEIEMLSWGYLIERCYILSINLPQQISRTNPDVLKKKGGENFEPSKEELKLTGRIVLDAWRLFRHEITLTSYTFENLMYHILHRRVPSHSFKNLSFWWDHRTNFYRHITANYYIQRVEGIIKLLDQLDVIGRTSELARLFGIQFYEVLSRGSQFRVESMMLRLAKPLNYIPVSPSPQQRARMRAPEWIPLIFEPESRFYSDPIIVLDFQSLYPSIIIAYNYCFSTCIGRIEKLGTNQPFEFGASQLKISRSKLKKLKNKLTFSPCGVGFVTPEVRKGILPRMLKEILETRLMVKASMKQNKENKILQRVLHSRQLGLKLIANVTYGYTSANFSGRMPCIEVGDSVVSKGRETLERAIKMIEQNEQWRARVVYGDTDSLFVLVPGRSRKDAFKIGEEIVEAVTNDNPPPVKLKLEKVYQPSILQTKKRYVGYMYETTDQKQPVYEAKGIETVRRDGCPAVAKILEKSLRILFETCDVSLVKRYVCRQFEKILTGRASVQDLIFAREYRGASGYRPGACVPALELAKRWTAIDKRREPRRGERVPYIIVHGPPGVPLIRLVRCPRDLLTTEQTQQMAYRPNAIYYITRVISPPLNRCFSLIGADVLAWYNEMPRKQLHILPTDIHFEKSKKSTISQYFATMSCAVCNNQTHDGLCEDCCKNPQASVVAIQEKICRWETSYNEVIQICQSCCSRTENTECSSLDCPVLYRLSQTKKDLKQVPFLRNLILKF